MKKRMMIAIAAGAGVLLMACGSEGDTGDGSGKAGDTDTYKAALLINGTLGDKSFYDSANEGLLSLQEELGEDQFQFKVEQMGSSAADEAKYEPTIYDYCDDGSYDVIILGTYQLKDVLEKAAADYPDQKFIYFDELYDFEGTGDKNVYNVLYKQNEVAYLVGAAAAMMTTDDSLPYVNPDDKIIGFLGGQDNSVVKDFLIGYIEGARAVEPDIQAAIGYVGNFYDSAAAKDIALTQYQNGVDVGFNVASSAGLGQIEAAASAGKYAFGVDSDQVSLLPDYAEYIPTSAIKNVGNSLEYAIKADIDGSLKLGETEYLGLAEGGVELVEDEHYKEMLPENIRSEVQKLKEQIINGEITVPTTMGDESISDDEVQKIIDSVKVQ